MVRKTSSGRSFATQRTGVVIPTLFLRNDYLRSCIASVRASGNPYVLLLGPKHKDSVLFRNLVDEFLEEPTEGSLSSKIDFALRSLPAGLDYITWIGDDDLLEPGSMDRAEAVLEANDQVVMTFGGCRYIDAQGRQIGMNKSGPWAVWLMRYGPFLAPQPGSLYRRSAFERCGGLDNNLSLAFDYDLAMNLQRSGEIRYLDAVQASYRWHNEALSVDQRAKSAREAKSVRSRHARGVSRLLVHLLNPFVSASTKIAGQAVNFRQKFRNRGPVNVS